MALSLTVLREIIIRSIHTWPEWNYAAVDVFMCGGTDPIKAADVLREAFKPARLDIADHYRGRIR